MINDLNDINVIIVLFMAATAFLYVIKYSYWWVTAIIGVIIYYVVGSLSGHSLDLVANINKFATMWLSKDDRLH